MKRIQWVERLGHMKDRHDDQAPAMDLLGDTGALQEKLSRQYHEMVKQYMVMQAMAEAHAEAEYDD
jgi:hypothetical protein